MIKIKDLIYQQDQTVAYAREVGNLAYSIIDNVIRLLKTFNVSIARLLQPSTIGRQNEIYTKCFIYKSSGFERKMFQYIETTYQLHPNEVTSTTLYNFLSQISRINISYDGRVSNKLHITYYDYNRKKFKDDEYKFNSMRQLLAVTKKVQKFLLNSVKNTINMALQQIQDL